MRDMDVFGDGDVVTSVHCPAIRPAITRYSSS